MSKKEKTITYFCKHTALFFSDNGEYFGKKNLGIRFNKPTFSYKHREFIFNANAQSQFKDRRYLISRRFYFYNINDPHPLVITNSVSLFDTKPLHDILDNNIIERISKITRQKALGDFLTPRNIIIGVVILVIIYFLATGQNPITFFTSASKPAEQVTTTIIQNVSNPRGGVIHG